MSFQGSSELLEPSVGSLADPAALASAQLAPVFVASLLISVWGDQLDASLLQSLAQRVRVIGTVSNYPFRFLPRTALGSGDADFSERGFRKRSFSRRDNFKPNSQRKTLTVHQCHPLRSLARLGLDDGSAPFLGQRKVVVQENLIPSQQSFSIQCAKQCVPGVKPHILRFPLLQMPPARRWRGILIWQKPPSSSRPQHPENAFQTVPVRCPEPAAIIPATLGIRQLRLNQSPLRIGQQLESTLAHSSSEPNSTPPPKIPLVRPNLFMKPSLVIVLVAATLSQEVCGQ